MSERENFLVNKELINDLVSIRKDCVDIIKNYNEMIEIKLASIEFFDKKIIRTVPWRDPSVVLTFVKEEDGHVNMFTEINDKDEPPGVIEIE